MSTLTAILNSTSFLLLTLGDISLGRDIDLLRFDLENAVTSSYVTKLEQPSMDQMQPTPLEITN